MTEITPFELKGSDGKLIRGDRLPGKDRRILFITGFLSKRWGNKSKALVGWCRERCWDFCCYDVRGFGDSDGTFADYTLTDWVADAQTVLHHLGDGLPMTIVGNSLGCWIAWLMAQEFSVVQELVLIAPAFNMMGERARQISPERRNSWYFTGWMPWDDEEAHRDYPIAWKWVEESEQFWARRPEKPRRVKTTILHGLQDRVIPVTASWRFTEQVLSQDPDFPIELILKTGDHRLSNPHHLATFRRLIVGDI
jgi:pimeloyl-ACP methyl ester carboxylesterase